MHKDGEIPEGIPDRIVVTDTLDLHGFFPEQVKEIVLDFIENGIRLKLNHLKIIHGKGKSRLKFEVYQVLKNHPRIPCSKGNDCADWKPDNHG